MLTILFCKHFVFGFEGTQNVDLLVGTTGSTQTCAIFKTYVKMV
jgi:hypothetical protein